MLRYTLKIADATHCNICGEMLSEQDLNNKIAIRERLGYGSRREDEEHAVRWCTVCFSALLASCKHPTQVATYTELDASDYDDQNIHPGEPLPGKFCNICSEGLNLYGIVDRLVIQSELNAKKHEVRFCHTCFDAVIEKCKHPTIIKDWDNYSHLAGLKA